MENTNHPQKLDFNLPLISTRRLCNSYNDDHKASCPTNSLVASQYTTVYRIPFCWEQAAGKSKETDSHDDTAEDFTPRPRLPPCRWRPSTPKNVNASWYCKAGTVALKTTKCEGPARTNVQDDSCDAGIDDDKENYNISKRNMFSEVMEALSLTEVIDDIVKKVEDDQLRLEKLNLESTEFPDDNHRQYTNYMIERFLPDATALAESSVALCASTNMNSKGIPNSYDSLDYNVSQAGSEISHQGCGFQTFLPCRMKHKLCSINGPVVQHVPSPKLQHKCSRNVKIKQQHRTSRKSRGPFIGN